MCLFYPLTCTQPPSTATLAPSGRQAALQTSPWESRFHTAGHSSGSPGRASVASSVHTDLCGVPGGGVRSLPRGLWKTGSHSCLLEPQENSSESIRSSVSQGMSAGPLVQQVEPSARRQRVGLLPAPSSILTPTRAQAPGPLPGWGSASR